MKSFTIYKEYLDLIDILNQREKEHLLYAICKWMIDDVEPVLNTRENAIFINLKRPLEVSKKRSKNGSSKANQNEIKNKSNENQNEIKMKSKQNQKENTTLLSMSMSNVYVNNIINFIENNMNRTISSYEYEQIEILVNKYSEELVLYAFQKTLEAGKKSLNYTKAILKHWEDDNLKTLEDIKQSETKKTKSGWDDDYWNE